MSLDEDRDSTEQKRDGETLGPTPAPSADNTSPTFPSEAESLLRHLNLGAARPASPSPASEDPPRVPNFEFECEVGRGGMGVVYKARQVSLNRTVALKMILASAYAAPGEVARFLAEAEVIAAVKHPNVVEVYDLGDFNGRPYFVMEFVEGGNLAARIKTNGPLAPDVAAELIATVAFGVQAAHDAGIVHRDLKPANILLSVDSGQQITCSEEKKPKSSVRSASQHPGSAPMPKVSDFGLAKRLASDLTRSQAVMGTPAYMAPEQAGGKAKFVGPAADVYALGVILYECLTGQPPFDSLDTWSLIRQVLEDPPEPLRKRMPGIPRDLELICLKCLEKEPHHRYPTAAALADDLNRFLNREPVSVRPISAFTRTIRWAKRHPAPAGLIAIVVLLLLLVPPLVVWQQGRLDRRDAVAIEARQKEDAAKRAEEEAKNAEAEAKLAKLAAERLADTRELFALQNKFRNRDTTRPLGWTLATQTELPQAVRLADGDPLSVVDLRSTAAMTFLVADLFPLKPIAEGFTASDITTDTKSGLVAIGEFKAWGECRVRLIDPNSGRIVRSLKFPTQLIKGSGSLDLVQDGTRALAFSPDGKRLFVGTRGSKVMRFDLDNPQNTPAMIWNASSASVEQLAVSPNGKIVYGLCRPEVPVFVWDADTGKPLPPLKPNEAAPIQSFTILPSGDLIAGNGHFLYRWSADHKLIRTVVNTTCHRLAATDGSMLFLGDGPRLCVYDRETLEPTDRFADPTLRMAAHEEFVNVIAVHPSRAYVATTGRERTVKVWEVVSGKLIGTVTVGGTGPLAVAWSNDGCCLLATADGQITRWRFAPPQSRQFACISAFSLIASTFLPDGRVAGLSHDTHWQRELLVGPVGQPADRVTLTDPGGGGRPGLASGPNGMFAVSLLTSGILLGKSNSLVATPEFTKQTTRCPRFSRDGRTVWAIVDSKEVRSFDPNAKVHRGVWSNKISEVLTGLATLETLAVGRDIAAAGGRDGSIYVLNAADNPVTAYRNAGDPVIAIAIAPDDSLIVAGTQNGWLRLVNLTTKTELPTIPGHDHGTTAVAFNREGTLLATGGNDRTVRLWKRNGESFEVLFTIPHLSGAVRDLLFSPNDDRLLVLLSHGHAARIWNIDRLKAQLTELKLGW